MPAAISKYLFVIQAAWRDALYYKLKLAFSSGMILFRVIILMLVYTTAYQATTGSLNGIDLKTAIWSIGLYFIVLTMGARRMYLDVSDGVRLGHIELWLNKPVNYIFYKMSERLGQNSVEFLLMLVSTILILEPVLGYPQINYTLVWAGQTASLLIGGIALGYVMYTLIGLTSFWLQNANSVYWLVDKSVMVLGGSYVPIALFPEFMRLTSELSPFGGIMAVTQVFNPNFAEKWPVLFSLQMFWLVFFIILTIWTFRIGHRKLSVNGG